MGAKRQWLGDSTPPFLQWLAERIVPNHAGRTHAGDPIIVCEDFVVAECTLHFDVVTLEHLAEGFHVFAFLISPAMLGEPVQRERLYMVMLRKDRLDWHHAVKGNLQASFQSIFERKPVLCPQDKFRAPDAKVQSYIAKLVGKGHLPECSRSSKQWSCYQAMPCVGRRMSIEMLFTSLVST